MYCGKNGKAYLEKFLCVRVKWMIHEGLSWSGVRREWSIGEFSFKYSVGSSISSSGWGVGGFSGYHAL